MCEIEERARDREREKRERYKKENITP